jgi:hypothetical protein
MRMESLVNFDLEMYPDILDMLDGVSAGDTVRVSGSFQVKELTDKRFTASFNDEDASVSITKTGGDDSEDEDDTDEEEESEPEETAG